VRALASIPAGTHTHGVGGGVGIQCRILCWPMASCGVGRHLVRHPVLARGIVRGWVTSGRAVLSWGRLQANTGENRMSTVPMPIQETRVKSCGPLGHIRARIPRGTDSKRRESHTMATQQKRTRSGAPAGLDGAGGRKRGNKSTGVSRTWATSHKCARRDSKTVPPRQNARW
jgi:hypothetical protein